MKKVLILLTAVAAFSTVALSTPVFASEPAAAPTLYEQLGGEKAVTAAVKIFYTKVLADDRVNGFFEGVDMDRQRAMQGDFLIFAFGGPNNYSGKELTAGHAHLVKRGLNDTHYDIIIEHLAAALKELGVKDEQIQQVADVANSVRGPILGKK
jgi:hemoglobin